MQIENTKSIPSTKVVLTGALAVLELDLDSNLSGTFLVPVCLLGVVLEWNLLGGSKERILYLQSEPFLHCLLMELSVLYSHGRFCGTVVNIFIGIQ